MSWSNTALLGLLALNLLLTSCSVTAAIMARSSYRALSKALQTQSARSLIELEAAVASLESASSSTSTTLRRLSSRLGMQDVRARRKEASASTMPSNLTPSEQKAWLRRGLQQGQLQIIRDGAGPAARQNAGASADADDDARH